MLENGVIKIGQKSANEDFVYPAACPPTRPANENASELQGKTMGKLVIWNQQQPSTIK